VPYTNSNQPSQHTAVDPIIVSLGSRLTSTTLDNQPPAEFENESATAHVPLDTQTKTIYEPAVVNDVKSHAKIVSKVLYPGK
jgi:hypothetical protein